MKAYWAVAIIGTGAAVMTNPIAGLGAALFFGVCLTLASVIDRFMNR